jgi:hypothetical protein
MFSPFIVLIGIIILLIFIRGLGIEVKISANTITLIGFIVILLGIIIGILSLFTASGVKTWRKLLLFLFYIPIVLFSLILVGL